MRERLNSHPPPPPPTNPLLSIPLYPSTTPPAPNAGESVRAPAAVARPSLEIRGVPPLTRFRVLPDKRHVLTQDLTGSLSLWDVALGQPVRAFETGTPFDAQYRRGEMCVRVGVCRGVKEWKCNAWMFVNVSPSNHIHPSPHPTPPLTPHPLTPTPPSPPESSSSR